MSCKVLSPLDVTPRVGVWIEIFIKGHAVGGYHVTPRVGVWIEISHDTSHIPEF